MVDRRVAKRMIHKRECIPVGMPATSKRLDHPTSWKTRFTSRKQMRQRLTFISNGEGSLAWRVDHLIQRQT